MIAETGNTDRMQNHPDIEFIHGPNGKLKSYVRGGNDVWEYVALAHAYNWDVTAVADHLSEPVERVNTALRYYRDHPAEVDEKLRRMDEVERDPEKHLPFAKFFSI